MKFLGETKPHAFMSGTIIFSSKGILHDDIYLEQIVSE